jgi:hypothetical protein
LCSGGQLVVRVTLTIVLAAFTADPADIAIIAPQLAVIQKPVPAIVSAGKHYISFACRNKRIWDY